MKPYIDRRKKEKRDRVGSKISLLRREGMPEDQAVATALSMERSGRLRSGGKYIRKGHRRSARR